MLGLLLTVHSFGQFELSCDTIKYDDSYFSEIDSTDIRHSAVPTIFDGGLQLTEKQGYSIENFQRLYSKRWFDATTSTPRLKFSALPFLGFAYSFGSQGAQFVRAEYAQSFSDSLILNIGFVRNSGNGYIRNASFLTNDVNLKLVRKGGFYSFGLTAVYSSRNIDHPGGLKDDSLVDSNGLEFASVWKQNSTSAYRKGDVRWDNYFNFAGRSATNAGLLIASEYSIINRKYNEVDTIAGLYPNVFINADTTDDEFNLPSIRNEGGFFLKRSELYIDGRVGHTYWRYNNLNRENDTGEVSLYSRLNWNLFGIRITNDFYFNLIGAYNGWMNRSAVTYSRNRFALSGMLLFDNRALEPFKRFYYSNNYDYKTSGNLKSFTTRIKGQASYKLVEDMLSVQAGIDNIVMADQYYFDGSEWRNDTLNTITATSVHLRVPFKYGWFNIHPEIIYTLLNTSMLPDLQIYSRVFVKGKLFKAKKLNLMTGFDVSYRTSYTVPTYVPSMDVIDLYNTSNQTAPSRVNLHAFFTLGIKDFNFYVRYENIGYYFQDKLTPVVEGYPVASSRIRLGIVWRFFN